MKFDPKGEYETPPKGGRMPTEGEHIMRLTECTVATSSAGNPMLACTWEVCDPDDPSNRGRVWDYLTHTPKTAWALAHVFRVLNPEQGPLDITDQGQVDAAIRYRVAVLNVYHEEDTYQGETKMKARHYAGDMRPLTDAERKRLEGLGVELVAGACDQGFDDSEIPF